MARRKTQETVEQEPEVVTDLDGREEGTAAESNEAVETRLCGCGCGQEVKSEFRQGHDFTHRGNLLRRYDAGEDEAGAELVARGWKSEAELAMRGDRGRSKADRRREALAARLGSVEVQISALLVKRDQINAQLAELPAVGGEEG